METASSPVNLPNGRNNGRLEDSSSSVDWMSAVVINNSNEFLSNLLIEKIPFVNSFVI